MVLVMDRHKGPVSTDPEYAPSDVHCGYYRHFTPGVPSLSSIEEAPWYTLADPGAKNHSP